MADAEATDSRQPSKPRLLYIDNLRILLTILVIMHHFAIGYGAPGKGNTLLNYCGIRTDFLDYTVDRNPHKQGLHMPGTHQLIRDPAVLVASQPTRGVDIGAAEYIHRRLIDKRNKLTDAEFIQQKLLEHRQACTAILMISEDLDEVFGLSDTIAVAVITKEGGSIFTPDVLSLIDDLSIELAGLPNVRYDRIASLATESSISITFWCRKPSL